MAAPQMLFGHNIRNPGNGQFAVYPQSPQFSTNFAEGRRFSTVTIVQPDPAIALSGQMTFTLGDSTAYIVLHAGQRFLGLGFPVPMLFVEIAGGVASDDWTMVLM